MIIPVTLNNEKTVLEAEPSESLLSVLRRKKLFSVKCGCQKGHCGHCMVLLDDKPVPSCMISTSMARECRIVTLEYFVNYPMYKDIKKGFEDAGIDLCGYCNAGKIFIAYDLIKKDRKNRRVELPEIFSAIKYLDCCCTDRDSLVNGILYAIAAKHAREGKLDNDKK